jgi:hypothetical protein
MRGVVIWFAVLASCATAPPNGPECNDTVEVLGPTPLWLPLVILGVIALVVILLAAVWRQLRR